METQQVLVQERAKREVAEAILAETAKALSAVRRAAADGGARVDVRRRAPRRRRRGRRGSQREAHPPAQRLRRAEARVRTQRSRTRQDEPRDQQTGGRPGPHRDRPPSHDRPRDQADEHIRPGRTRHVLKAALRPRERAGTIAVGVSRSRRTTSEDHRGRGVHPGAAATGAKG